MKDKKVLVQFKSKRSNEGEPERSLFSLPSGMSARSHSRILDKKLGFRIKRIENKLSQKYQSYDQSVTFSGQKKHYPGSEAWVGLNPDALQTPYSEIYDALCFIRSMMPEEGSGTIVDIGAAYGRVGFVKEEVFPLWHFIGYELIKGRQQGGQRAFEKWELSNSEMICQNVLDEDFVLPEAKIFFLYDFSDGDDVDAILTLLEKRESIFLIAHGARASSLLSRKFKGLRPIYQSQLRNSVCIFTSTKSSQFS